MLEKQDSTLQRGCYCIVMSSLIKRIKIVYSLLQKVFFLTRTLQTRAASRSIVPELFYMVQAHPNLVRQVLR